MSQLEVDIGGALTDAASPGISEAALDRLDNRVETIHHQLMDELSAETFGYRALSLPETVDVDAIEETADEFDDPEAVIVAGIGGSALGAATIAAVADVPVYTLDNVDPVYLQAVLDSVSLDQTVLVGVSRSGTTTETLANFLIVRQAFTEAGIDWTDQTAVITGEDGPLAALAHEHGLTRLSVPDGVPGRFSVLSSVGLFPAALAGADIAALIAGARQSKTTLSGSLFETPAYAYGATAYALGIRGASVTAMMPYAESLEPFGEWFAQLWAESLGKDGLGQVPTTAVGVTDQHSQLQLYRSGPRQVVVSVVGVEDWPALEIPETDTPALAYLGGKQLSEILNTERKATIGSLHAADRPVLEISLPDLSLQTLGELLYTMETACILAGELYEVDPFSQPAVEWGKRATRGLLQDVTTKETQMIDGRNRLSISASETPD